MDRELIIASPRGFCAGVERAISIVELLLERVAGPLFVRKEIVHNRAVVDDLVRRGVVFVEELDEVPDGATVVFSAHGVSPAVRRRAAARRLRVVDATCPLVTRVHRQVIRRVEQGDHVVLIGHAGHEEVEGTMGEAPGHITLVTGPEAARTVPLPEGPLFYVTQTTLSVDETAEIVAILRRRRPDLQGPARSDICYATQNRQDAVKALVKEGATFVLVVGSANSSNSRRLCEVARRAGAAAHLVDSAADLDPAELADHRCLGLSAGASAPEFLVREIVDRLGSLGWSARELVVMQEDVKFDLPPELRA